MRSKKAMLNMTFSTIYQLVSILCGFILPILIIKTYGSGVNGLVSSITQFLAYITLLESGFGPVVKSILYKPIANKNHDETKKILKASERFFRRIAYIFIAYLILLCIFYPFIVINNFKFLFTLSLIIILAVSTFFEYFFGMTYKLFLQANQKIYVISIIQLGTLILNTIVSIILILNGFSIQIVKIVAAFIFILRPLLQNLYVKKFYKIDLSEVLADYKIKNRYDALVQHIASIVHNNIDITILSFLSVLEVSVYSVHAMILRAIRSVFLSLNDGVDASFGDMLAKGEIEHLNKSFRTYELFYYTLITIIFSSTLFLITPFISVYTNGVTDVNYIRPLFGYLFVITEFLYAIRIPYNSLALTAGHFKQTKKGAWIEVASKLLVSLILVNYYGIMGLLVGTFVSILIRTIEFTYHSSKYILKRSFYYVVLRIINIIIQATSITLIIKYGSFIYYSSYIEWIVSSLKIVGVSTIIVLLFNYIFYRNDFKSLLNLFKKNFLRRIK